MAIGVFDSGLGGLTVLRALRAAMPNQPLVYLGDNANAPYGQRPDDEVFALTAAGVERLFRADCRLVLIACNTASALALRKLQQEWLPGRRDGARRVLGVFVPIVEAITGARWSETTPAAHPPAGRRRVLFFATPATVRSNAFENEVAARAPGVEVVSQACPGLVDALEAGDDARAAAIVAEVGAEAMRRAETAQAAILGCTHYPLAEAAFRAALPRNTTILSQPDIVAASLARYLERRPEFETIAADRRAMRFLTTGAPRAVAPLAARFWPDAVDFEPA